MNAIGLTWVDAIYKHCVRSWFYQWYQWYTDVVQGSSYGTIGNTIGANGNANGTIGSGTIGKPMVPLAINGTIGKISTGTIGRTPNRHIDLLSTILLNLLFSFFRLGFIELCPGICCHGLKFNPPRSKNEGFLMGTVNYLSVP